MYTQTGEETSILDRNKPLPQKGIICAHPRRASMISGYLENSYLHTNYRGYQVYCGLYKEESIFIANTNIGGPSAAILLEELIARGVKEIIRLGTSDNSLNEQNNLDLYILEETVGLIGMMSDYGFAPEEWGRPLRADKELTQKILMQAQKQELSNIKSTKAYHIDSYYAYLNPERFSKEPHRIQKRINSYRENQTHVRDMESGTLFMLGKLRGVKTACVLQSIIKHGVEHEYNNREDVINREREAIQLVLSVFSSKTET